MAYFFPIYRSNDYNLRTQIMDALQYLLGFSLSKSTLEPGDNAIVPANYQMIAYRDFTVAAGASLTVEGELVVLGGLREEPAPTPATWT